jgi:hypothetical protein
MQGTSTAQQSPPAPAPAGRRIAIIGAGVAYATRHYPYPLANGPRAREVATA